MGFLQKLGQQMGQAPEKKGLFGKPASKPTSKKKRALASSKMPFNFGTK